MAKLVVLIESETTRGEGKDESDMCRRVRQYFTVSGELVAEVDPCQPRYFSDYADGRHQTGWHIGKHATIRRGDD